MAFTRIPRTGRIVTGTPTVTFGPATGGGIYLSLNVATHKAMGEPAGVVFDYDAEETLLRIAASDPQAQDAYLLTQNRRVIVTGMLHHLGMTIPGTTRIPAHRHGPSAVTIPLDDLTVVGIGGLARGAA